MIVKVILLLLFFEFEVLVFPPSAHIAEDIHIHLRVSYHRSA